MEQVSYMFRACVEILLSAHYIDSSFIQLAQDFSLAYDKVALRRHWELCMKYCFDGRENWYEHLI